MSHPLPKQLAAQSVTEFPLKWYPTSNVFVRIHMDKLSKSRDRRGNHSSSAFIVTKRAVGEAPRVPLKPKGQLILESNLERIQ